MKVTHFGSTQKTHVIRVRMESSSNRVHGWFDNAGIGIHSWEVGIHVIFDYSRHLISATLVSVVWMTVLWCRLTSAYHLEKNIQYDPVTMVTTL